MEFGDGELFSAAVQDVIDMEIIKPSVFDEQPFRKQVEMMPDEDDAQTISLPDGSKRKKVAMFQCICALFSPLTSGLSKQLGVLDLDHEEQQQATPVSLLQPVTSKRLGIACRFVRLSANFEFRGSPC